MATFRERVSRQGDWNWAMNFNDVGIKWQVVLKGLQKICLESLRKARVVHIMRLGDGIQKFKMLQMTIKFSFKQW